MTKLVKIPTAPFHPGYGCAIFAIMIFTFSAYVGWILYTGVAQDKEFSKLTTENAPPLAPLDPGEGEKADVRSKLYEFADPISKGQAADLTLTIDNLNVLLVLAKDEGIGTQDDSVPYGSMLRFHSFDPRNQEVIVDLRMPINKLPWAGGGKRYLVGTATLKPYIEKNSFEVRLQNITVPGKNVSEGFLTTVRTMPLMSVAKLRPEVASALGVVSSFTFKPDGGALILHAIPAKKEAAKAPPK